MLALDDARPCGERARWLKHEADRRLLDSLAYLAEVVERVGCPPARLRPAIEAAQAGWRSGRPVGAAAYAFHSLLADAARAGDLGRMMTLAAMLEPSHFAGAPRAVSRQGEAREEILVQTLFDALMAREHAHEYKTNYDARAPDEVCFERSRTEIERILALIEEHDPATRAEIDAMVTDILVIGSDEINAGSSFRVHGLILLRELAPSRCWTTYLENLVHEAAHLHLFLVWTQDPIFVSDPNVRRPSPLRRGERPLSGIFHAMFVLARTIRAAKLFGSLPGLAKDVRAMSTAYNNRRNPAPFEEKFEEAVATLGEAELTPVGQGILDGCMRMVRSS